MIDKTTKVNELDYISSREANVEIEWYDNEKGKRVILRGVIEEVEE